jgi:hypothetical protein
LSMHREMPAAVKMLMVSPATRSAMRPSMKRPVSSIKADTPPPPGGGGATTKMVLDSESESILDSEESRLKAKGVQEEAKSVPLLASRGHICDEFPSAEKGKWATVGILKPVEQLGGKLSQPGVNKAAGESVQTVLIV